MTGAICLGAAEPQLPKIEQAVSSGLENRGLDGAPMVLVPAGPFTMGSHDGFPNERPEHTVTLDVTTTSIGMKSPSTSIGGFWKRGNMNLLRHGTMKQRRWLEIGRLLA
jgi:hypothetical protein